MTSNIHRYQVKMKVSHHLLKENAKYSDINSANRKQTYENSVYILNRIFKQCTYIMISMNFAPKRRTPFMVVVYGQSQWGNFLSTTRKYEKEIS